jgi:hypothetical protein
VTPNPPVIFDGGTDGGVQPVRSPPLAHFEIQPPTRFSDSFLLDASGSFDSHTAAAELQMSWSFTAPIDLPPWTAWTNTKIAQPNLAAGGSIVVLAVRDGDDDIGYAARQVFASARPEDWCVVTTDVEGVDGATDCATNLGLDGKLSFDEAVQRSNSTVLTQTIVINTPMALRGPPVIVTSTARVIGSPGVSLQRELILRDGPLQIAGLEITGGGKLTVEQGQMVELTDSRVHDSSGLFVAGKLAVKRTVFERCASFPCITVAGSWAQLSVEQSSFSGTGAGYAIDAPQCLQIGSARGLDLIGNTLTGFATAIRIGLGCVRPSRLAHQTFHRNGVAIEYAGGGQHVLRNSIFTEQRARAIEGCAAVTFASRRDHLLHLNADDDCLASDLGVVAVDPHYVAPAAGDLRLGYGSPAIDAAPLILENGALDVNGPFPGLYQGLAPDFGGRETY